MEDEPEQKKTTRPRFLKQLVTSLAVGVGAAAALAGAALADHQPPHCCPNCIACPGGSCPSGQCPIHCNCIGIGESYCVYSDCRSPDNCYNGPC